MKGISPGGTLTFRSLVDGAFKRTDCEAGESFWLSPTRNYCAVMLSGPRVVDCAPVSVATTVTWWVPTANDAAE